MKRGFPRPSEFIEKTSRSLKKSGSYGKKWNNRWYPWPYSASDHAISNISAGRMEECVHFKRCGTCGEPVKEEMVGLVLYNPKAKSVKEVHGNKLLHQESGPYHLKCLVLNFTACPHLVESGEYMPGYGEWKILKPMLLETYGIVRVDND